MNIFYFRFQYLRLNCKKAESKQKEASMAYSPQQAVNSLHHETESQVEIISSPVDSPTPQYGVYNTTGSESVHSHSHVHTDIHNTTSSSADQDRSSLGGVRMLLMLSRAQQYRSPVRDTFEAWRAYTYVCVNAYTVCVASEGASAVGGAFEAWRAYTCDRRNMMC